MAKKKKAANETDEQQPTEGGEQQVEAPKAAARPKLQEQNGITRPAPGGATARVWEIADKISHDKQEAASRKEVMEAGRAEGLNEATITTQFGRWKRFYGLTTPRAATQTQPAPAEQGAAVEE